MPATLPRFAWRLFALALVAATRQLDAQPIFLERHSDPNGRALRAIVASESRLVAVGDAGRVLTSTDGGTWERSTADVTETLRGVAFGAGQFIAVGDDGRIVQSNDGLRWRTLSSGTAADLYGVAYTNGTFVAVGEQGTVLASSDGATWTARVSNASSFTLRGVAAFASPIEPGFIACGDRGTIISSTDAVQWTRRESGTTEDLVSISPTGFFILRASGTLMGVNRVVTASGTTWSVTAGPKLAAGRWRSLATRDDGAIRTLVVGESDAVAVGTADLLRYESGTSQMLHAALFARGTFFAIGEQETILQSTPEPTGPMDRLINLSNRAPVAVGNRTLISGFVVTGTGRKRLLLRAPGPSLGMFGISTPPREPTLTVYDSNGRVLAQNSRWSTSPDKDLIQETTRPLTFLFPDNSSDAALVVSLPPGAYTAHVTAATDGVGLVELYDADRWPLILTSRVSNMSSRCFVGTGQSIAIAGLAPPTGRKLLVRAVGPALAGFGVSGVLANPKLEIIRPEIHSPVRGTTPLPAVSIVANDDWNTQADLQLGANPDGTLRPVVGVSWRGSVDEIRDAARHCGAFPLPDGSKDAAMLVSFDYSPMTIQVSGADGGSGIALVEIYEVDAR